MATEQQLQEGLQDVIQTITGTFTAANVVINDYSRTDEMTDRDPLFIIGNVDNFSALQASTTDQTGTLDLPASLAVRCYSWQESLNTFRDARQAIINTFAGAGNAMSLGGLEGVSVASVDPAGGIDYVYQNEGDALPVFIVQSLLFRVELF